MYFNVFEVFVVCCISWKLEMELCIGSNVVMCCNWVLISWEVEYGVDWCFVDFNGSWLCFCVCVYLVGGNWEGGKGGVCGNCVGLGGIFGVVEWGDGEGWWFFVFIKILCGFYFLYKGVFYFFKFYVVL